MPTEATGRMSHCGEDTGQAGGRKPHQDLALPGIRMRRGLERDTSPSVPGWQAAIYKGPPCTGHPDKAASSDLGAISRNSRWGGSPWGEECGQEQSVSRSPVLAPRRKGGLQVCRDTRQTDGYSGREGGGIGLRA